MSESTYRMYASPVDWENPASVRARIKELEEDLWLYDHDNNSRWECERQIERLESWLEDLNHKGDNP